MDSDSDMEMEVDDVPVQMNRFKHQSRADQLKSVHAPTALDLSKFNMDIGPPPITSSRPAHDPPPSFTSILSTLTALFPRGLEPQALTRSSLRYYQ
ncbi:hypothetical protein CONPUDRAFT_159497 [Coniophora puteana RWD-64-598 SS2]|uniref:Uncharacterized protein n=1 Tax=Coniophora puteana (strain RWD-64-598) TaxID=741705 RepID=A0A5M3M8X2_CONPW|nr:uncharacterized protein CONPUDRAFT_159497 [Coniophora puteana RWD-64-598 SS2]EIW75376.1 hypothetical protein CONPUDRAFT_159497 [Coniophora puteana RWD-64-598 SS2]